MPGRVKSCDLVQLYFVLNYFDSLCSESPTSSLSSVCSTCTILTPESLCFSLVFVVVAFRSVAFAPHTFGVFHHSVVRRPAGVVVVVPVFLVHSLLTTAFAAMVDSSEWLCPRSIFQEKSHDN